MKKKYLISLCAAALVAAIVSFGASAEEITYDAGETIFYTAENAEEIGTDDQLLEGYFLKELRGEVPSAYSDINLTVLKTRQDREIYNAILNLATSIANGTESSSVTNIKIVYTPAELGLTSPFSKNDVIEALGNAVSFENIYDTLLYDNPYEFYWHDKTVSGAISAGCSFTYTQTQISANYKYSLVVAEEYRSGSNTQVNTAKTSAATAAAANARALVNANLGKSDYEKLVAYKDYICNAVEYNFGALGGAVSYGNPWQIIYVFDNDSSTNVVCEGYAKAFLYLCELSNIECYAVSGYTNEGHMWNIVVLDGVSYLVDITNCDGTGIGAPDKLFLKGLIKVSDSSYQYKHSSSLVYSYNSDTLRVFSPSILAISSEDYVPKVIDRESIEKFVERLYVKMLNRASDSGKATHVNALLSGATAAQVAEGFVLGEELKVWNISNEEFVRRMYLTFLDREADPEGLAVWTSVLDKGCSYGRMFRDFCNSAEFKNVCDSYGINQGSYAITEPRDINENITHYCSRMYTKALGRAYDVAGLNIWTEALINGTETPESVAMTFLNGPEFKMWNHSDEVFVDRLYETLFNRPADAEGKQTWLNLLAIGTTRETAIATFVQSQEFILLKQSLGL